MINYHIVSFYTNKETMFSQLSDKVITNFHSKNCTVNYYTLLQVLKNSLINENVTIIM